MNFHLNSCRPTHMRYNFEFQNFKCTKVILITLMINIDMLTFRIKKNHVQCVVISKRKQDSVGLRKRKCPEKILSRFSS